MISEQDIDRILDRAFDEDLPDITTDSIFGPDERGRAFFLVKQDGVIAGLPFASRVFTRLDASARFEALVDEGSPVRTGDHVAEVEASVRALLSGERTALNLMQRASGIATATRRYVDAIAGTKSRIYDTRKTAPGLRVLDKYAVKTGGGENHRHGLHDMFLVKNNHIDRAGSIGAAVSAIRERGMPQQVMVEVRDLDELRESLDSGADLILLDNMPPEMMRQAVGITGGKVPLEASGGVTLETIRDIALTGVERISVGALTHSVRALDISMRIIA